jgi:putative flippase GtrA
MRGGPGPLLRIVKDQRLAFLIVGAANTGVGFGLFAGFEVLFDRVWDSAYSYFVSLTISHVLGVIFAFTMYRHFVFRVRGHLWLDLARFESVYLVSLGVNYVALFGLVTLAGMNAILAQLLVLVVTTLISWFGHKHFSFRRPGGGRPAEAEPAKAEVAE